MNAPPQRVLLIKPSSFGDIVQSLPVLAALRRAWPQIRLDWLVKSEWAGLLASHPLIHELMVLPETPRRWLEFLKRLRAARYNLVIDLQGLLRSGLIGRLTGAPVRIGLATGREGSTWFYTLRVALENPAGHAVERYLDLVRGLGIAPPEPVTFPLPSWEAEEKWARVLLTEAAAHQPLCVVHPAARWANKQWPATRYADIVEWLVAETNYAVALVGAGTHADEVAPITASLRRPALNLIGRTTLAQLGALLRRAALLITNDSGPMHLAAAIGTPVVAIFGPTDPAKVGPYGSAHVVLKQGIDCSPCRRNVCVQDLQCLKAVTVEAVCNAVRELALPGSLR